MNIMEAENEMRNRFRQNLPKFVETIENPVALIPYLPCLTSPNRDEIRTCQHSRSCHEAVLMMYEILLRKKDGCTQLAKALRNENMEHPELADLIDPPPCEPVNVPEHQPGKKEEQPIPKSTSDISSQSEFGKNHGRKECNGDTLLKDLDASVIQVYKYLDPVGSNDWKALAGRLGYSVNGVRMIESHHDGSPGFALISDWSEKENATLQMLVKMLKEINRADMVSELETITNYKFPADSVSVNESDVVKKQVHEQDQQMQTERKRIKNENENPVNQFICDQIHARTDNLTNNHTHLNTIPGLDLTYGSLEIAYTGSEQATASNQTDRKVTPEAPHCEPINGSLVFDCNGINTDMMYGDKNRILHSVNLTESSDSDYGIFRTDNDFSSLQEIKFRYTGSKSGHFGMTAVGCAKTNEVERRTIEVEPNSAHRSQPVVRQESREEFPVQTDPSLSSSSFVNLKQERKMGSCRQETTNKMNEQVTNQLLQNSSLVSQLGNYRKLHTEDAPTLGSVSSTETVQEDNIRSRDTSEVLEMMGTFGDDTDSLMNSDTALDEVRQVPEFSENIDNVYSVQNTEATGLHTQIIDSNFQTFTDSIFLCSVHPTNNIWIQERRQEELAGEENRCLYDGCHQTNDHPKQEKAGSSEYACNDPSVHSCVPPDLCTVNTSEVLQMVEPIKLAQSNFTELKEIKSGTSGARAFNIAEEPQTEMTTELVLAEDKSSGEIGEMNESNSFSDLKKLEIDSSFQNQKMKNLRSNNTAYSMDREQDPLDSDLSECMLPRNGNIATETEPGEAEQIEEPSLLNWSSLRNLGIVIAAGTIFTMALSKRFQ